MSQKIMCVLLAVAGSASSVLAGPALYHRFIGTILPEEGLATAATNDGGSIIAAARRDAASGLRDILLLKLDYKGATMWERQVIRAGDEVPLSITQTSDGGYALVADLSNAGAALGLGILKVDAAGNYMWGQNWFGNPNGIGTHGAKIIELTGGDLIIASRMAAGTGQVPSVIHLNAAGGTVWAWGYPDLRYGGAQNGSFMDIRPFRNPAGGTIMGLLAVGWTQAATTALREPLAVWIDAAGVPVTPRIYFAGVDQYFNGLDIETGGGADTTLVGLTLDTNFLQLTPAMNPGPMFVMNRFVAAAESIFTSPANGFICGGNDAMGAGRAGLVRGNFGGAFARMDYSVPTDILRQIAPATNGAFVTGQINSMTHGNADIWAFRSDDSMRTECLEVTIAPLVAPAAVPVAPIPMTRTGMQFTAWVPQIPRISDPNDIICLRCPADFNGDGAIDFFDYLDFVNAYTMGLPAADFNGDGVIDFFDYLDFVGAFSSGC